MMAWQAYLRYAPIPEMEGNWQIKSTFDFINLLLGLNVFQINF